MLKLYLAKILDLIFPPICLVCRDKLKDAALHNSRVICDICFKKIERNLEPYSIKSRSYFTKAESPYLYEGVMRECVHLLKYRSKLQIMDVFKELLAQMTADMNSRIIADIIIPVPLHKTRLRQRGFNQAELLACLIEQNNTYKIQTRILKRVKPTAPQSDLSPSERISNVKGAFVVSCADIIRDKDILLVDDVFTTGATTNECARVLMEAGAKSVNVWTLARTRGKYR